MNLRPLSWWRNVVLVIQGWGAYALAVPLTIWALDCHESMDQRTTPPPVVVLIGDSALPVLPVTRFEGGACRLVYLPLTTLQPSAR